MKKVCWLFCFSLRFVLPLSAQYEQILNNPQVIWAAEIDVVYSLEPPKPGDSIRRNDIVFWKNFDPKSNGHFEKGELLIEKMLAAARSGEWPAWQLGDMVRQLSNAEVIDRLDKRDTIEVVDVETGMRKLKVAINSVDPSSFFAVRAKQLLYFDEKKGDFELYTAAIGPVRRVMSTVLSEDGEWQEIPRYDYVPFWLKMPAFSKKKGRKPRKVNDPDISWAAQLKTINGSPEIEQLRPFKNFKPPVMQVLLDRFHFDRHYPAQDALGRPIRSEERDALISKADTVVTFDPETYEEKTMVVNDTLDAEHIPHVRLIENWFWDDRRRRLIIQLHGFSAMQANFDNEGNYRFDTPLFYRWRN